MSFRYKSALLSLGSLLLIYGWYFISLVNERHGGAPFEPVARLAATVLAVAIVQVVGHIAIAMTSPDKYGAMDERERSFDRRATGAGYYILIAGALLAIAHLHLGAHGPAIANGVLLAIVVAECARQALFLLLHHRTA